MLREEGFSDIIIQALESVTKFTEDEDYDLFVQRSLKNRIGRIVKIADLNENLDIKRIGVLDKADIKRLNKYKKALEALSE